MKTWNAMIAVLLAIAISTGAYAATITVDAGGDIAAANAIAVSGDVIDIAAGTYAITAAIEIKDGVTYQGAGSALTIIDCGGVTRAFFGWGDRAQNDDLPYSDTGHPDNTSGPKGWVIQGLKIINGVADDVGKSVRRVGDPDIDPALTVNEISDADKSTNGGGILVDNGAEGTLIDVAFDNCNALAVSVDTTDPAAVTTSYLGSGGAVNMGWATVNILDCSFTNNSASNDGGAVRASNPDLENWDLSIENSIFTNNSARDDGGAIYAVRRNLSVINCVGDGNKTGLDPAIIADNTSGDPDGGFLYVTGAGKVSGTSYTDDTPPLEMIRYGGVVKITGCTITNGDARRGGGIRTNSAAQLIVTDTSFTNCNAIYGGDGGTIFANSPSPFNPAALDPSNPNAPVDDPGVYIDGVTVDGGTAEDDGGGINIDNWGVTSGSNFIEFPKVVINNSVVKNCRAGAPAPDDGNRDGGGIRVNQKLNVTITNTLVDNCTAGRHGAGIVIDGQVNALLMDRCQISNCSNDVRDAKNGDGAGFNMDTDDNVGVMVSNCIFNNNVNNQDDGVFRIDAHEGAFYNCTFVSNASGDQGIIRFNTSEDDASVQNGVVNCLFVNNDHSGGSDQLIAHNKGNVTYTYTNNIFFGNVGDGDPLIDSIADADLGLYSSFVAAADPLVDTAGGDYHLAPGSEAIDAGTAEGAPDHDYDGAPRPHGAAHDVGAYEAP
jgi:predicted outer membrane repeat protein